MSWIFLIASFLSCFCIVGLSDVIFDVIFPYDESLNALSALLKTSLSALEPISFSLYTGLLEFGCRRFVSDSGSNFVFAFCWAAGIGVQEILV